MSVVPDYPARILAGEQDPDLPAAPRSIGYRPLDGYLQLAAHNAQFHRIAQGRSAQVRIGAVTIAAALARTGSAAARQAVALTFGR